MENCAFIDIITTGNDLYGKNNCPIQFCCEIIPLSELFSQIFSSKKMYFNIVPDEEILTTGYIHSGGLTNESLEKSVDSKKCYTLENGLKVIYKLLTLIKDKGIYLIGYNHINYDLEILNNNFKRVLNLDPIVFSEDHIIDVMKLAELKIPITKIGNYTMESVFSYITDNPNALLEEYLKSGRGCCTDISITKQILKSFIDYSNTFSDINKMINEPYEVKIFNFGKYKGASLEKIFETDRQYFDWLIKNKSKITNHPNLISTIQKMIQTVSE